jgi:hypothetical protein
MLRGSRSASLRARRHDRRGARHRQSSKRRISDVALSQNPFQSAVIAKLARNSSGSIALFLG